MKRRQFGPYECVTHLGDGGTGTVFECVHTDTGDRYALKAPRDDLLEQYELLRREVAILRRLKRSKVRGVVQVLAQAEARDVPWYVMELLEGKSLDAWNQLLWAGLEGNALASPTIDVTTFLAAERASGWKDAAGQHRRPASLDLSVADSAGTPVPPAFAGQPERALRVLLRLAQTLLRLHSEGVTHGDLTPRNVLFRDESDPVLIDFGTALLDVPTSASADAAPLLRTRGTPGYAAPELLTGGVIDGRSDLFSFGCIAYELATGARAFTQHSQLERPRPMDQLVSALPPAFLALVDGLLQRAAARRLAHVGDVVRVLRELLHDRSPASDILPLPSLYRPQLHGRDDQLRALSTAADAAAAGRGGLVWVSGPSGIGKSRLLEEFGRKVLRHSKATLFWCRPTTGGTNTDAGPSQAGGFELFAPLLESARRRLKGPATDEQSTQLLRAALAHIEPLTTNVVGGEQTNARFDVTRINKALLGLRDLLRLEASETRLLLLLLDDLQWADELSLKFLEQQATSLASDCVLLVISHRTELGRPELSALAELASVRIDVAPLGLAEIRSTCKDLLVTESVPDGLPEFLERQSEGNPFFVAEYARAAVMQGLLRRDPEGWSFDSGSDGDRLTMPASVEGLFQLRTRSLSTPALAVLRLASVMDREFSAKALATVGSEVPAQELLEELVAREVLVATRPGQYRFVHDKLREEQERALSDDERKLLHERVALQVEQEEDERPGRAASLGWHWAAAAQPQRAVVFLESAATEAWRAHTLARATELFQLALRQCELLPAASASGARRAVLHEGLADVLMQQARHSEARKYLSLLLDALAEGEHVARARALRKLAASHWTVHEFAAASEALTKAEGELAAVELQRRDRDYGLELIEVRLGHFERLYFAGKLGLELDRLMAELGPLIQRDGNDEQRCVYYFIAASYRLLRCRYAFDQAALDDARRGLDAAVAGSPQRLAFAHFVVACALMFGEKPQCCSSLAHFEAALASARELNDATLLSRILIYRMIARVKLGEVVEVERAAQLALEAAEAARLGPYIVAARGCQGWVAFRRNEPRAQELLQAARDGWNAQQHSFPFRHYVLLPLIELAASRDEFEAAQALIRELDGSQAHPPPLASLLSPTLSALAATDERRASAALSQLLGVARGLGLY